MRFTWGWAGDGASEFWEGCWLCSCRWGTAGMDPAPPPAPSCTPEPCWVRAAFSRYKDTDNPPCRSFCVRLIKRAVKTRDAKTITRLLLSLLSIVILLSLGCCDTEMFPFAGQIKEFGFWRHLNFKKLFNKGCEKKSLYKLTHCFSEPAS